MSTINMIPNPPRDFVISGRSNQEIIKISADGDIYIKDELITNNKTVGRYMTSILTSNYKNVVYELLENDPEMMQEIITKIRKNKLLKLK